MGIAGASKLPGISVALATYNGSNFLRDQLESIAKQTVLPAELVVSDDGSDDGSLDVIRDFAASAPFAVRILPEHDRLRFADNFLNAALHCQHEIVAFSDQDDVWLPRKLETGLRRLTEDGSLLCLHTLTLTDEMLRPTGRFNQGIVADTIFEVLEIDPYMTGWGNTMMFRRELAGLIDRRKRPRHPGSDRPLSHDTWIYSLAAALGRVSHIAEPLILYRQHGDNAAGFRKGTVADRFNEMRTVPMGAYRERMIFNAAMASLLEQVAQEAEGDLRLTARRAADVYTVREERVARRIELHQGKSVRQRLAAYRSLRGSVRNDPAALKRQHLAGAKDLLLGVAALGRHR
jgi:glycosyltransferase involved in cell wall biosynthesis